MFYLDLLEKKIFMKIKNNFLENKPIVLIPMAGLGTRIKEFDIKNPKPLVVVENKTLIEHSIDTFLIDANYVFVTRKYDDPEHNLKLTKIFDRYEFNYIEIQLDEITNGATETALKAKEYIDNDQQLYIINCDQHLNWNVKEFINFTNKENIDGSVVLFKSTDPKCSFAEIKENRITSLVEKKAISDNALIGIHYWKNGKDFVFSAEHLIKSTNNREPYISETYNYLTLNKNIVPYFIDNNQYMPLGTSEDIESYIRIKKEYNYDKPKTIFCDIDGTILKHAHSFSNVTDCEPILLDGVLKKFNEWDSYGHKIILTTARKESARALTELHLKSLGLAWDQLIMGISSGQRVLINDKYLSTDKDRAISINVVTDDGFKNIDWSEHNL